MIMNSMDMYCFADYHTHTQYSHGTGTVRDNVAAAAARGLEVVAISDHGPNHLFGIGIEGLHILEKIRSELIEVRSEFPMVQGLVGIEANIISTAGDLDLPPEKAHLVDVLQANIHALVRPKTLKDGVRIYVNHYGGKLFHSLHQRSRLINTEAVINAVYRNRIHIITHPGLRFNIDTRALARACQERGTYLEINTSHDHMTPEFLEIAAGEGAKFVIGSDAHSPERVGDFAKGLALARQVGLSVDQIVNARVD